MLIELLKQIKTKFLFEEKFGSLYYIDSKMASQAWS